MNDKTMRTLLVIGAASLALLAGRAAMLARTDPAGTPEVPATVDDRTVTAAAERALKAAPLVPFAEKGLGWLAEAQQKSGGWGGGSHAAQNVRDPHAVVTDPGTTAFAAMAFLRAGHTPTSGKYKETVARSLDYLLGVVESARAQIGG